MFAKSFSSLLVAASLAVSSLGFAATPSAAGAVLPTAPASKSVKIRHTRRPNVSKVTAPSKTTTQAAPAMQPRTPSKVATSKAIRTSKLNRPAVKSAPVVKAAVR
jgi:hypothetical protein